jgi:tetratricopeptide (TPR) repeat protein
MRRLDRRNGTKMRGLMTFRLVKALGLAAALLLPALALFAGGGRGLVAAETAASPQQAEAAAAAAQARALGEAGKWDEAIATAEKAIAADEKCGLAYYARGCARQGKGQLDEAIKDFEKVTGQSGRDPALVALRADAFAKRSAAFHTQGKYLQAIDSAYFGILEKNDHFECHFNRGQAYLARHEWEKAIRSFDRCLQKDADKAPGWTKAKAALAQSNRGFARGARGEFDSVIWEQGEALKADPGLAIAYERRGAARIAKAMQSSKPNLKEAIADITKALEIDPNLPEALCDRALLTGMAGDLQRAAADADAAVAAAPKLARAHFTRGIVHVQQKDSAAAIKCFDEAIDLDPKNADAFVGRGNARLAGKQFGPAIDDFTKAVELDAKAIAAYHGRAQARRKQAVVDGKSLEGTDLETLKADTAKAKELEDAIAKKNDKSKDKKPAVADDVPHLQLVSKPVNPSRHAQALKSAKQIDKLVAANYAEHKVEPMPRTTDEQFVRRIYLDIVGTIPSYKQATAFLASTDPDKRTKLIDELLGSDGYASHSFNFWADILRYRDRLSEDVRGEPWRQWIKQSLAANKPYDTFVHEMLAAEGLIWENPATGYLQRDPGMPLDNVNNTVRIFLGTRIGCAQCHNHPFDKWTQKQFYQTAAFVFPTQTQTYGGDKRYWSEDPNKRLHDEYAAIEQEEEDRRQRSYQFDAHLRTNMKIVNDNLSRNIQLPKDYAYSDAKPGDVVQPKTLFGGEVSLSPGESPRKAFARWLTSKDNPRFALTIANRLWKQVFGAGQIEPVDDMMDSTVAENPPLMAFLEAEMKRLDFDMKEYLRILFNTETYQRQSFDHEVAIGTPYHFPGPMLRRMTAEQAWDSFLTLARPEPGFQELPAALYKEAVAVDLGKDTAVRIMESRDKVVAFDQMRNKVQDKYRAKYDRNVILARASELPSPMPPNHFLRMFGQSDRELISASSTQGSVPQVLFMYNGPVTHMLLAEGSTIYNNIVKKKNVSDAVKVVFLSILNREPDAEELATAISQVRGEKVAAVAFGNVVWSLVNTREFMFVQ